MTRQLGIAVVVWAFVSGATMFHTSVGAQGTSVTDGVYSDAQAARGATLYAEQCASCHGEDMLGVADLFPPLMGEAFVKNWDGKSVADLFDKIAMTMPALDPGSLTPEQTADLVAGILSASKYPAGTADLAASTEALQLIQFVAAGPSSVGAPGTSVTDGVYSDAQAARGAMLYTEQCASCHGEDMLGVADLFPPLMGEAFVKNWDGKSVADLFDKIAMTMPALDPGSLTPEQTADLVAGILSASKYPAGTADLAASTEALQLIQFVAAGSSSVGAPGHSVADGVYSDAQAARGAMLYTEQCASCHGEDMSGVADLFPPLMGEAFVKNWDGKPVAELFDKIAMTMPALDPGSLSPEQTADLLASLLSASKFPSGTADLAASAEALKQIQFVAPKP